MYKIALCDDESGMRFQIAEHLREYYENIFEINEYADGEDLLTDICNEKYFDIIFLEWRCCSKRDSKKYRMFGCDSHLYYIIQFRYFRNS